MTPFAHVLSLLVLGPLAAAVGLMLMDRRAISALRGLSLLASLALFALSAAMALRFDPHGPAFQFVERADWIPELGASFHLGVDGISLWLVLLTTLLVPVVIAASWGSITDRVKEFHVALLVLEAAMVGVFLARDLLLFYLCWEAMLVPMYLLIGVWGGERRVYAAMKFVVYTLAGSLLMLVAIIYLYVAGGAQGFDLEALAVARVLGPGEERWLFAAFALAFAIKLPLVPFHTWLPDAHVEAPTGGSVLLAGVLLKMGAYGFLRLGMPLFPQATLEAAPLLGALALVGIVYGALMALAQEDIKKLIAYSSVSHLGFVMLGIASLEPAAVTGGVYQMLNHGVTTGALFLLVGVIYERRHTRRLADYGGIAAVVPVYATVFLFITLASIGLPGLNGFVGEFLILLGTWSVRPVWCAIAVAGVVLGAAYMLRCYRGVFQGPITNEANRALPDMNARELAAVAPLVILALVLGVLPRAFLEPIEPAVQGLLAALQRGGG